MDTDRLFEYLVVTDQVDEFLGLKEEDDDEQSEEETDLIDDSDNELESEIN